jgi:hypothetical protein
LIARRRRTECEIRKLDMTDVGDTNDVEAMGNFLQHMRQRFAKVVTERVEKPLWDIWP